MDDTIEIGTIEAVPHCSKCGSDDLLLPDGALSNDDLTDNSLITCVKCGAVTTYTTLIESCEADAAENVKDNLWGIGNSPLD